MKYFCSLNDSHGSLLRRGNLCRKFFLMIRTRCRLLTFSSFQPHVYECIGQNRLTNGSCCLNWLYGYCERMPLNSDQSSGGWGDGEIQSQHRLKGGRGSVILPAMKVVPGPTLAITGGSQDAKNVSSFPCDDAGPEGRLWHGSIRCLVVFVLQRKKMLH